MTTPLFIECPNCGSQVLYQIGNGSVMRLFAMETRSYKYKDALKGDYHTWTCTQCSNRFIRSNVLCGCSNEGVIVKSKKPKPKFTCSKCSKSRLI